MRDTRGFLGGNGNPITKNDNTLEISPAALL